MYTKRNIGLTNCQVKRLPLADVNGTPVSFTKYSVTGNVPVYLTRGQLEGLTAGKPLKFSKKQLTHMKTQGGFLGAFFNLIGPTYSTGCKNSRARSSDRSAIECGQLWRQLTVEKGCL